VLRRALASSIVAAILASWGAGGCVTQESAAAGEPACEDLLVQELCFDCLEASCCEEVRACLDDSSDGGCVACVQGDADACLSAKPALALYGCLLQGCNDACSEGAPGPVCDLPAEAPSGGACAPSGEAVACNPVTNEGCDEGEACDFDAAGFRCFPGPNDVSGCEPCGPEVGFCRAGFSCLPSVTLGTAGVEVRGACARQCCDDGDCGAGVCGAYVEAGGAKVGVCIERKEP
jgi:hypothetical protein